MCFSICFLILPLFFLPFFSLYLCVVALTRVCSHQISIRPVKRHTIMWPHFPLVAVCVICFIFCFATSFSYFHSVFIYSRSFPCTLRRVAAAISAPVHFSRKTNYRRKTGRKSQSRRISSILRIMWSNEKFTSKLPLKLCLKLSLKYATQVEIVPRCIWRWMEQWSSMEQSNMGSRFENCKFIEGYCTAASRKQICGI